MDKYEQSKDILLKQISDMREDVASTLKFYEELLAKVPTDERWKFYKNWRPVGELFIPPQEVSPVEYSREILTLLDLISKAINEFSKEQLVAFYLGLGCRFFDMPFWGYEQAERSITKIRESRDYYVELKKKVDPDEWWKFKKSEPKKFLFVPNSDVDPVEYTGYFLQILEAQMNILLELPFVK